MSWRLTTIGADSFSKMSSVVRLVNFISWEVSGVNIGRQLGLKWCSDTSKGIKLDASEELVAFDLTSTSTAKSVLGIADKTSINIRQFLKSGNLWFTFGLSSLPRDQAEHPRGSRGIDASSQSFDRCHGHLQHRKEASRLDIQT